MENLSGKVAAVTGAASGIGRSLAVNLAAEGCDLALADIDGDGLEETAGMLWGNGVKVTTHVVDMSNREQVYDFAAGAFEQHGKVNIIINNAGVAIAETLAEITYEDFEWLFGTNFWGVVYGTKAFLPYLLQCPEGHIVNISSTGGFSTTPYMGSYCASKFAVRGFTETLVQELRSSSVGVTCVHPSGVKTNIARNSRSGKSLQSKRDEVIRFTEMLFLTSSDRAAKRIIGAIKKDKPRLIVGLDGYEIYALSRICPITLMKLSRLLGEVGYGRFANKS